MIAVALGAGSATVSGALASLSSPTVHVPAA
jgi:hypothetical protein